MDNEVIEDLAAIRAAVLAIFDQGLPMWQQTLWRRRAHVAQQHYADVPALAAARDEALVKAEQALCSIAANLTNPDFSTACPNPADAEHLSQALDAVRQARDLGAGRLSP